MSDEEYDEMDALTAFLDDDEEENPYDRDDDSPKKTRPLPSGTSVAGGGPKSEPFSAVEADDEMDDELAAFLVDEEENPYDEEPGMGRENFFVNGSLAIDSGPMMNPLPVEDGVDQDKSTDEEKSKEELIEELRLIREQLKLATQSQPKKESSQELFSEALSGSSVTEERHQKKKLNSKSKKPSSPAETKGSQKKMQGNHHKDMPKPSGQNNVVKKQPEKGSTQSIQKSRSPNNTGKGQSGQESEKPQESRGEVVAPKKSFREMFSSLGSDEDQKDEDKAEPSKVSKFLSDIEKPAPEEKPSSLAGGEMNFYQSKKKRVAHSPKNVTSPPGGGRSFLRDPHKSSRPQQSSARKGASSTEDPWEIEPFTKIRISNPVVSMSALKVKMQQRTTLRLSVLKRHIKGSEIDIDWVTIGVVISKSPPKTSKNGKAFSVWKLNDLSTHCPLVALFLFGQSHDEHWKTAEGSVVGLLNAKVMPSKDGSDDLSLSIDNPQKMIVLGKSKDLGWCKGSRKDGGRCTMFVNKSECEWCDFHIQNQYKKQCARRPDLQATYSGLNPTDLIKKATQNVIYGGKHYNPRPLKATKNPNKKIAIKKLGAKYADEVKEELKCVKLLGKDRLEDDTLVSISGSTKEFHSLLSRPCPGAQNFIRHMVDVDKAKGITPIAPKDLLKQHKSNLASMVNSRKRNNEGALVKKRDKENTPAVCKTSSQSEREKELRAKSRQESMLARLKKEVKSSSKEERTSELEGPRIGASLLPGGDVDLDFGDMRNGFSRKRPLRMTREELAKARAVALVRRKGQFQKKDPNETQRSKKPLDEEALTAIKKRTEQNKKTSSDENAEEEQPKKKRRKMVLGEMVDLESEEMKAILEGSSLFKGQLEAELEEKYFSEMEQKEKLELRMDSIMEKEVKVVSCKQCKFTWFCPSNLCKTERHNLNWQSATQRFFQCQHCHLRTISFFKYPTKHCRGCRGGKFARVSMLNVKEKKDETLLLRGEERKWVM